MSLDSVNVRYAARPIHVDLAPYPDLVITRIDAPTTVLIGDPVPGQAARPRDEGFGTHSALRLGQDRHPDILEDVLGQIVVASQGENIAIQHVAVLDELADKLAGLHGQAVFPLRR